MKIEIDSSAIYDAYMEVAGDYIDGDGPSGWVDTDVEVESKYRVPLPPVRVPLPFGSVDGSVTFLGENYYALIGLNPPDLDDLLPDMRVEPLPENKKKQRKKDKKHVRRINNCVESCHKYIVSVLKDVFGSEYERMGRTVDGYFRLGGEPGSEKYPRQAITRTQGNGVLTLRTGGSGLVRRVVDDKRTFGLVLDNLADNATLVLNAGLYHAKEIGLIPQIPQIPLRLGPPA